MKHIRIFIEYPCIEYNDDVAIDYKVENFGGSTMGREQSGYQHVGIKYDVQRSRVTASFAKG